MLQVFYKEITVHLEYILTRNDSIVKSFQWAFHVSPKTAPHGSFQTARYQLKKRVSLKSDGTEKIHWNSEQEFGLDAGPDDLVVEVQIGGIKATRYEFEECLREVKVKQNACGRSQSHNSLANIHVRANGHWQDPTFNDRVWMQQALLNMARENVLSKYINVITSFA